MGRIWKILLGAMPLVLAVTSDAAARQEPSGRANTVEEAAALRIRNWGLNPKQAQCVTALYVARATQMPNGRWRVIEDRRFAGTSFVVRPAGPAR